MTCSLCLSSVGVSVFAKRKKNQQQNCRKSKGYTLSAITTHNRTNTLIIDLLSVYSTQKDKET